MLCEHHDSMVLEIFGGQKLHFFEYNLDKVEIRKGVILSNCFPEFAPKPAK